MRWRNLPVGAWLLALGLLPTAQAAAQYYEDAVEPAELGIGDLGPLRTPSAVYVGNDVCRQCHEAAYQKWLGTYHARTFVPLRSMMAAEVAKAERITASEPALSGKCLGCHATAHDVPAAFRGPGFRLGEGVSCERCHGPGGEHVRAYEDPESGANGTMEGPSETTCRTCHKPKPSHEKLGRKPFDYSGARAKIAHPLAAEKPEDELEPEALGIWRLDKVAKPSAAYAGSAACGPCHEVAYRRWQASAHASAFGALRTETAYSMDLMMMVATVGGPARNGLCLSCHATGHDAPAAFRESGFRLREGVGCEKCHGPGADHIRAMHEHAQVPDRGLTQSPTDAGCLVCHKPQRSHEKLGRSVFSFPVAWEAIAH